MWWSVHLKDGGNGELSATSRTPLLVWIKSSDCAINRRDHMSYIWLKLLLLGLNVSDKVYTKHWIRDSNVCNKLHINPI